MINDCARHPFADLIVSIGSEVGPDGELIADQCEDCIEECEAATW